MCVLCREGTGQCQPSLAIEQIGAKWLTRLCHLRLHTDSWGVSAEGQSLCLSCLEGRVGWRGEYFLAFSQSFKML